MLAKRNRCQCCGRIFLPDRRVGLRQKVCAVSCRKVRKKESNKRFRRMNPDYWLGRYSVVKAWRKEHPDYQRIWRRRKKERLKTLKHGEIQAEMFSKAIDTLQEKVYLLREIQAEIPFQLIDFARRFAGPPLHPV
jgi:hypothetical protein